MGALQIFCGASAYVHSRITNQFSQSDDAWAPLRVIPERTLAQASAGRPAPLLLGLTLRLVLAIIDPVLEHFRFPFSLDPLIAEAKRRMRRRRLFVLVIAVLLAAGLIGGVLAASSPGGPGTGNGGVGNGNRAQNNQPASFKGPAKPPVTAAIVAAAHRDEAKMLRLFVPPPGAQPLAHEPAFLQHRQTKIFGLGPTSSAKFVRFGNWRVRSSVAAVESFEQAHPPRGGTSLGYGVNNGPNVPPNRSLTIIFPRIHGLVSSRIMRVSILRLPSGGTAIRVAATNRTWIPHRFRHRAPPPPQIDFVPSQHAPIAGQTFTGVTVIDENPQISPLVRVSCGGLLGNHALPGSQHVFTTRPPPGRAGALARAEKVTKVEEVTCSWQIPAHAAGERLRLGSGHGDGARVATYTARTKRMPAGTVSSPEYSWVVRP